MTRLELLKTIEAALTQNAGQEALWLCAFAEGTSSSAYLAMPDAEAHGESDALAYARRRANGEPLQYILGSQPFYGLDILTDRRALIPRRETELLVDAALGFIAERGIKRPGILDMCTGTGAIAIAMLKHSDATAVAADVDPACLALARKNAVMHDVMPRVRLIESDMFFALPDDARFDILLCNPPYIPAGDIDALMDEVRLWEPRKALDGGADGLDFYRVIARDTPRFITRCAILEVGEGQAEAVADMMNANDIRIIKDEAGIDRVVMAIFG